jgi:tetratricopeptide (TPR) repeat protein
MLLIFIGVGGIIYSNTLNVPFYFDDFIAIVEDPYIRIAKLTWEEISPIVNSYGFYLNRPVSTFTFALNYYFGQYNVIGYHIVNIIIHVTTAILLFFVVQIICSYNQVCNLRFNSYGSADRIAFFTALLWLVHPLHTQSITYIVQRMNSMAAMFYMLSFLLYLKGRLLLQHPDKSKLKPIFYFSGCAFSGIISIASKEIALTLPLFIILFELFFFQKLSNIFSKKQLFWIIGGILFLGGVTVFYLDGNPLDRILEGYDHPDYNFTLTQRLLTEFRVVIYYISLIFFPHPARLTLDHDYPLSHSLIDPSITIISLLAIVVLNIFAVWIAKKQPLTSFCILWFFGNLVLESSVLCLDIIFEHRTYLPSMMVCFLVALAFYRYIYRYRTFIFVFCSVLITLSAWTLQRNTIWGDEIKFWHDCVSKSPRNDRALINLGTALLYREDYNQAIQSFKKAVQINASKESAYYNMGIALKEQGKTEQAVIQFNKCIDINSNFSNAYIMLGGILLEQYQYEHAIKHFKAALNVSPLNHRAMNNIGNVYLNLNRPDKAIDYYKQVLKVAPHFKEVHNNWGNALMKKNMFKEAIPHFAEILRKNPNHVEANINMGAVLARLNKIDAAILHYKAALSAAPDNAEAHNNLGVLLVSKKEYNEASLHFQTAVQIRPDYIRAKTNLKKLQTLLKNKSP